MTKRSFALDQNFPTSIVDALRDHIRSADLRSIREIAPDLPTADDHILLYRLGALGEFDGLITNDARMLNFASTLTALHDTKLTLVAAVGEGHNPIRATGLVLANIDWICRATDRRRAQVWQFKSRRRPADPLDGFLNMAARKAKVTVEAMLAKEREKARAQLAG